MALAFSIGPAAGRLLLSFSCLQIPSSRPWHEGGTVFSTPSAVGRLVCGISGCSCRGATRTAGFRSALAWLLTTTVLLFSPSPLFLVFLLRLRHMVLGRHMYASSGSMICPATLLQVVTLDVRVYAASRSGRALIAARWLAALLAPSAGATTFATQGPFLLQGQNIHKTQA